MRDVRSTSPTHSAPESVINAEARRDTAKARSRALDISKPLAKNPRMGLPAFKENLDEVELAKMMINARSATEFLKALGHEGRLMILCHLASKERSVTELEQLLSQRQAAVSQQLARLRLERLVECRREGKAIYYRLADERVRQMVDIIYEMFCTQAHRCR